MKQSVATMDLALLFVALASPAAAQEPAEPSEPSRLAAGRYSDTLTITFTAES